MKKGLVALAIMATLGIAACGDATTPSLSGDVSNDQIAEVIDTIDPTAIEQMCAGMEGRYGLSEAEMLEFFKIGYGDEPINGVTPERAFAVALERC